MLLRALLALVAAGLLIAACGPPGPTPEQICGDRGCDACAGFQCPDAGVH